MRGDKGKRLTARGARSTRGGAFSIQTDYNPGGSPSNKERIINLTADANNSKIMLLRAHRQNFYLRAHVYDDYSQSWSTPNGDPLETDNPGDDFYESFAFAWETVFQVPTLGQYLLGFLVLAVVVLMVRRGVISLRRFR